MKEEFIDKARSARQALLASLDGIDEAALTSVRVCGTWTARDVLAHVAASDLDILDALRQARAGEKVTWPWDDSDVDTWNEVGVVHRRQWPMPQILAELTDTHARLLAELESWPADAGPFGPESWDLKKSPMGWLPGHDREHAEHLQALRAR